MLELVLRFLLVGAIAFGGGQAALPLVERIAVAETGWLTSEDFGVGVGLSYVTPGPVLILAAFVGQRVDGFAGALAATVAVFLVPMVLSIAAAAVVRRLSASARFRRFQRYAGAAAVGLLGVTLCTLAWPVLRPSPALFVPALAIALAVRKKASPALLLAICAAVGAAASALR